MKRFPFPVLLAMLLLPVSLGAQSFFSVLDFSVRLSLFFFPEDNGRAAAPMPILPSPGGSASYSLNKLCALELSLDLYATDYDYDYTLGRPVPANQEFRSAFVIGALLGVQPVFRFSPGEKITIRVYGGAAADLRICLLAWDVKGVHQQTGRPVSEVPADVFSYFWKSGRWFFPFAGAGMDFAAFGGVKLGFDMRAWFPVWRLWTGEDLPFIEGFRFAIGFRAAFS